MKPVKNYSQLPKFLQVTSWQVEQSYNKYLTKPYIEGEIVKVQSEEYQKPNSKYDDKTPRVAKTSEEFFKERYCRIMRKDSNGKFTHSCALEWNALDYLKRKREECVKE